MLSEQYFMNQFDFCSSKLDEISNMFGIMFDSKMCIMSFVEVVGAKRM